MNPSDLAADYANLEAELKELKAKCLSDKCNSDNVVSQTCGKHFAEGNRNRKDIEDEIRNTIRKQLELYAADKTGMADFAMRKLGGCIVTVRDTRPYGEKTFFGIGFVPGSDPHEMLNPSVEPGHCWAFHGSRGTAVIKLIAPVFVTHLTLEHILPLMAPSGDISSAPKKFTLFGLDQPEAFMKHNFGQFEFKAEGPSLQTFSLVESQQSYQYVEVVFESNHGNAQYTCVYRVRIHGKVNGLVYQSP
ncbi:Sad1 / UNC-like C-terminal [Nesidiocoris tenuis]|uniref:Sad1 / UNC-like C-terminal n=1 Tax=Nesidiocoris tenuis TaxID=355587 RepID=A0ABN7B784_9HEMI|nr:Sad1 / UNC-like C-terminal [Nesidiocoris tenuis]